MKISYNGIMENVVTFLTEDTLAVGDFVKVSDDDTVAKCTSGDTFDGVVVGVNESLVSVQVSGFTTVKISSALSYGYTSLAVGESNTAQTASSDGRACTVVNCDTTAGLATILF